MSEQMFWVRDAATGRWVRTSTPPAPGEGILSREGTGNRTPAPRKARARVPRSAPQPAKSGKPAWVLEPLPNGNAPWSLDRAAGDHAEQLPDVSLRPDRWSPIAVSLSPHACERLQNLVKETALETGGILLGTRPGPGEIHITSIGHAGPRAERTPTSLRADGAHDYELSQRITAAFAGQVRETGNWHTHPALHAQADRMSEADITHAASILELLGAAHHVELIVTPDRRAGFDRPTITAWIVQNAGSLRPLYVAERASLSCREPGRAVLRSQGTP